MLRLLTTLLALTLTACPPQPTPDASVEPPDAAVDAGPTDAGRPPRDAGTPDAGFTAAPIESWCQQLALADCTRDVRCGRLTDAGFAGCLTLATAPARCDQAAYTRGVREFRVQYLEAEALRCLNGYAHGSCEDAPDGCSTTFAGLAHPDAGCLQALDCNDEGFCDLYDNQCPHRCRAWLPLGAPCDTTRNRCAPFDSCESDDAGVRLCRPGLQPGDACLDYSACGEGSICSNNVCTRVSLETATEPCGQINGYPLCPAEYFCHRPDGGAGTCQRKAGIGGTCVGAASCLPSLRCTTVLTTGTCLPRAALNEPCVDYADCEDGLYCKDADLRCAALPTAGGSCSYEATAYRCAPGHSCAYSSTSDDTCVAWKQPGEPCSYTGECLSNDCGYGTLPDGGFGGTCRPSCSQRADGGQ